MGLVCGVEEEGALNPHLPWCKPMDNAYNSASFLFN